MDDGLRNAREISGVGEENKPKSALEKIQAAPWKKEDKSKLALNKVITEYHTRLKYMRLGYTDQPVLLTKLQLIVENWGK